MIELPVIEIDGRARRAGRVAAAAAERGGRLPSGWPSPRPTPSSGSSRSCATCGRLASTGLAAVGRATAGALEAHHLRGRPGPGRARPPRAWPPSSPTRRPGDGRVLFVKAAGAGDALGAGLAAKGWAVDEVVAYRTVDAAPPPAAVAVDAWRGADVVTFASPSAVAAYLRLRDTDGRPLPVPPVVACIGPSTADGGPAAGLTVAVEPAEASVEALVRRDRGPPRGDAGAPAPDGAVGWSAMSFPERRMRRLRRTPALRRLVAETRLAVDDLVAPLFVREGIDEPVPIRSMPGARPAHRRRRSSPRPSAWPRSGSPAIVLFGVPGGQGRRPARGAGDPDGIVQVALAELRAARRRRARADRRPVPRRVHRPRPLRACSARRHGRQRRHARAATGEVAVAQAAAGRRHGGAERDDGRPGRGDPRRRSTAPASSEVGDPRLRGEVRLGPLRPVPGGGRRDDRRRRRPPRLPAGPGQRGARRWPRSTSTSPRGPTS